MPCMCFGYGFSLLFCQVSFESYRRAQPNRKKKLYGISDWTNGKCVLYIHLLYSDLGLNLESYMGLGGFSVLFLYKITSLQTGKEEMKETDIL